MRAGSWLRLLDRALRADAPDVVATDGRSGPRTGVVDAPDVPWRWWVAGSPGVSRHRRHPRAGSRGRAPLTDTVRR